MRWKDELGFRIDCREESKPDSDMDEPWIMTVKGLHSLQMQTGPRAGDEPSNNKLSQKVQNGSSPVQGKSPPKDSNLNHYRTDKVVPVSMGGPEGNGSVASGGGSRGNSPSFQSSRPHGISSAPATSDNRKESKEKRNSKDINYVNHRGDHQEKSGWKSDLSNANNVSSTSGKPSSIRSSCLSTVIAPLIMEVGIPPSVR